MSVYTEKKSLILNTQFRNFGSISNPEFILQEPINDIISFKVKSAMVPLSFYTIDSRNNKIYFVETANSSTTLTATIPSGNYTSTTLPAAIKTAMEAVSAAQTYTITYNNLTNNLTISTASNFKLVSGVSNAYYEMGITSD